MSIRDLAASAKSLKGETPTVTIEGDTATATSKVYDEATATAMSHDDLLRGWALDPAEWQIVDGSLVVNRWMVTAYSRRTESFSESWNYQYKARIRRRVELVFADLPTVPTGCARCSTQKHGRATGSVARSKFPITFHVVIGDTQVKPGVPNDHLFWIGRYIREEFRGKKTRIVHVGDHWDMPSLSSYDFGKAASEGRRVKDDILVGNRGFEVLDEAMGDDPDWDFHFLFGNHEDRVTRYVNDNAELVGFLSLDNLLTPERWQRHGYLEPVNLDGIVYSHYFYNKNTGKPLTGSVEGRIKEIGHSFVMGHQQGLALGFHYAAERQRVGVVCGSSYYHDEDYKGPQGNVHDRCIVVLNEVEDGSAYPMPVSLDYLCRRYEGHRLSEHEGRIL
jgi:hypothetical protein